MSTHILLDGQSLDRAQLVAVARGTTVRLDPGAPAPFITGGMEQRGPSGLPVMLT